MPRPTSSASRPRRPLRPRRELPTGEPLSLFGLVAALVAGGVVLVVFLAAGLLLYQRLYGGSLGALALITLLFGGLGAYAAWLVGVIAYSTMISPAEDAT